MPVKTVVILSDYAYIDGGASSVSIQSAVNLAEAGVEVIFFSAVRTISPRLHQSKVKIINLGQYDILNNPNRLSAGLQGLWNNKAKHVLQNLLSQLNPAQTIIHAHTWTKALSSSVYSIARKMGFQVIITVHDYFLVCPNGGLFNYKKNSICATRPLSAKCLCTNCDNRHYYHKFWRVARQVIQNNTLQACKNIHYLFISDFSKKQILKGKQGIHDMLFLRNAIQYNHQRYRVSAEENELFLFVGRLSEEKGIRLFCQAVDEAKVKAVVIGNGCLLEELRQKHPQIRFTGWLEKEQIVELYESARCLVFPSLWYEASPLATLEAQAYGLPTIVPDECSAAENIMDRYNGLIFKTGSKGDLVHKMRFMLDDELVHHLSGHAFASFDAELLSMDSHIRRLKDIYEAILDRLH